MYFSEIFYCMEGYIWGGGGMWGLHKFCFILQILNMKILHFWSISYKLKEKFLKSTLLSAVLVASEELCKGECRNGNDIVAVGKNRP